MSSSSLSSSLRCFPPPSPSSPNLKNNDLLIHNFNTPLELKQLHARLIKTNTPLSILPLTKVASVCALSPSFSYAHQIFSHLLETPQTSIWNSCLIRFAEGDSPSHALLLFYQMRLFDVLPDTFTCSFVLKACLKLSDVVNGKIIHGIFQKLGFGSNLFLQNMILNLYGLCGEMGDAMLLFEKMPQRDVVTWNIMIAQLIKRGDIDGAYCFFLRMPDKNVRSWTSMISGFVQCGKPKEAIDLFMKLQDEAVRPNEVTFVSVLAACADLGELDLGRSVHEYSTRSGFKRNCCVIYVRYANEHSAIFERAAIDCTIQNENEAD
ncbi:PENTATRICOPEPTIDE REPEAT-CONTAINING PROTEIN [Salix koriyanagi]|uniref:PENTATRICOPEPTIDE REPEAT-CONTAINING PROTEIN n=1 Tax=Salix koriyanagi TaxID=2511006 RepID=A0A9Q1ALS3_9ROSI|nr:PENTATRICOPEPTIDE REPEAT-CONTAINING PROTEIN [Salix koriyanagi]